MERGIKTRLGLHPRRFVVDNLLFITSRHSIIIEYWYLVNSCAVADTISPSGIAFTDFSSRLAEAGLILAQAGDRRRRTQ